MLCVTHKHACYYGSHCAFDVKQHFIHVVVSVSVPSTASFLENAGTVTVCATLTGMTAVPISVTVSATEGKSHELEGSQKN